MTVHTCTMRVEKVCKVREEPAPCLITAQGATGCDGVWQCVAGRARTKYSLREAQWRGTSLRLLSQLAANCNMRMRRWDFVAAYLQGELLEGEVVYCLPPPGHEKLDANGNESH